MQTEGKIVLKKNYSRDITLVFEQLWANGFEQFVRERFGKESVFTPYIVFYVTTDNLEIWEHEKAISWYQAQLLEKNKEGDSFIKAIITEYKEAYGRLEPYLSQGATADKDALRSYIPLQQHASNLFSAWYYTGIDPRTPEHVSRLARELREKDEFFARTDVYMRECIVALGVPKELSGLVLFQEFPDVPSIAELEKRKTGIISFDEKHYVTPIKEFAREHPEFEFEGLFSDIENVSELQGTFAYKGLVKGVVRIVKNYRDMEKVAVGDVLVSPMTTPDFLPAMQRAAAFVTDEGGIMCHAAIVARELKKPCITGTKIATQVLQDGDMVEVDAEHGAVRIIDL